VGDVGRAGHVDGGVGVSGVAFASGALAVLDAWDDWKREADDTRERRNAMQDRYGRRLMVSRRGFGHGSRVVGFEEFETDTPGDVIGKNGELRVPKKGPPYSTVVPNIRRKAGKSLRSELDALEARGPRLPGMPEFQLVGLHSLAPALFEHSGTIWAYWGDDVTDARTGGSVDLSLWESRPLSAYFAAKEAAEVTA
jgi:hypothetical protein